MKQERTEFSIGQSSELEDLLEDLQNSAPQLSVFAGQPQPRSSASSLSSSSSSSSVCPASGDKQNLISDIMQLNSSQSAQHRGFPSVTAPAGYSGSRAVQQSRAPPPVRNLSMENNMNRAFPPQHRSSAPYALMQQQQQPQGMMGGHSGMGCADMMSAGQGWGPQGPHGATRMASNMNPALANRGVAPNRMNMQMMGNEMEMASYPQAPPNQTAPWPDRMMSVDHYGNQTRFPHFPPSDDSMTCLSTDAHADEGALLTQLCSVLKDFEGLEEIDKMLGIPSLAGQGPLSNQDQYLSPDSGLKPPLYSQHLQQQQSYGSMTSDPSYHRTVSGHMGQQRVAYPPMMRALGHRPGAPNQPGTPQPNNLRLQLQHRLQATNRQPVMNQMSGVSNMNLPLRSNVPNQGALNAQMLAQRQREYLSNHLRQRQQQQHLHQQRALMMRGGQGGPSGAQNPRMNPQSQPYAYPGNSYGTGLAPSPPPLSPAPNMTSMTSNMTSMTSNMAPLGGYSAFSYHSSGMSQQQQQDPGFSPLLSPRHQASGMMQQNQVPNQVQSQVQGQEAPPGYHQPNADINGWGPGPNASNGNNMYSSQSQFSQSGLMFSDGLTMSGGGGHMGALSDQVNDGLILDQLGMDLLQDNDQSAVS